MGSILKMVSILKEFIAAGRMGDWKKHLSCIAVMVPLFHAAGHLPYKKAAQLYLQDMKELKNKINLKEYNKFTTQGLINFSAAYPRIKL